MFNKVQKHKRAICLVLASIFVLSVVISGIFAFF